ncbi:Integrase catalytic region [Thermodesulfobium narugense DSM 14796]|uniref:Integrase catalytic region n=1 Tax=Thermodesulfobium narugense DSM 14796 TaxID=747365 RepID=M1E7X6_9BACT|nr:Integrase catalytic region [Thermodesulfobium narugense DSM 14796]AEE13944.1 Integrase catalytic region [Thermodesulfobium narugense DSM 14796]AEE14189.1 Integrase catalytic region [Thermodesulfobium narugense DSM 14796]AEE14396.1 Integrase catalytic region [Thermodesulfobium narugense DSM 14796]AEE14686.1 Integrase catalytic region [Thermodesulfobium narugense DSM 14796]
MSVKESRRVFVIEQAIEGNITNRQAAEVLGLSKRQIIRLKERVKTEGVTGLVHKNRGRESKQRIPKETRERIVKLAQDSLHNASCQQIAEILEEFYNIDVSSKTVNRILKKNNIPLSHTHRSSKLKRSRKRLPQEGLLSQIDASPFEWLEDRGPMLSLHGSIDDATSKVQGLHFELHECLFGYLKLIQQVAQNFGIPKSIYSDRHTIFFSPKEDKLSISEELSGQTVPLTQFGRAISELGIRHIPARSPQAKGRIERLWGTLQKRLTIELRMAGISTIEAANEFLPDFIKRFNQRFAVVPDNPKLTYSPCPSLDKLEEILSWHQERKASHGSYISYLGHIYQLVDSNGKVIPLTPKSTVKVLTHLDGSFSALYADKYYLLQELLIPPKEKVKNGSKNTSTKKPYIPAADHPWRHMVINKFKRPNSNSNSSSNSNSNSNDNSSLVDERGVTKSVSH